MNRIFWRRASWLVSGLTGLALTIMLIPGSPETTGFLVVGLFLSLAASFRFVKALRGFSYTILIFAAVSGAMYFPAIFTNIGFYELKNLIIPLLMIIMFGMGTTMSIRDFAHVIRMPRTVLIGVLCQFTIMPAIGYLLAIWTALPPEIAAGIILVGCSPSGLASNVMAYLARANVALSVTLTAISTLLAPFVTPLLMKLLADQFIPIDPVAMFWSITKIVIVPIIGGLIFHHMAHGRFKWVDRGMPYVSMAAIAVIIAIITAAGRDSLLDVGLILMLVVTVHNLSGYALGYWGCRIFGMDVRSSRTIAFEVGMQNSGLASGIALEMGRVATMGLGPAVFGPVMNVTGSSLATWWGSQKFSTDPGEYDKKK